MEHPNHHDGFNNESEGNEFINPFHNRSLMRRPHNMGGLLRDEFDQDLKVNLEITKYSNTMNGGRILGFGECIFAHNDLADYKKVKLKGTEL